MLKFIPILKQDESKDENPGGGGTGYESEAPPAQGAEANGKKAESQGDSKFDDLGYEIAEEQSGDQNEKGKDDKKPEVPKEDSKVEQPASGYTEDVKEEESEEEPPAEEEKPVDLGYELKTEGMDKDEEKKLRDFAKAHGLNQQQAQAYADLRIQEIKATQATLAQAEKEAKAARTRQRAEWQKELKADKTFGGANYSQNVLRVEKVLEEFMPSTKKVLTERSLMLAPYLMRDLAKIADSLYATEKLVQGDAIRESQEDKKADDPLSFYE